MMEVLTLVAVLFIFSLIAAPAILSLIAAPAILSARDSMGVATEAQRLGLKIEEVSKSMFEFTEHRPGSSIPDIINQLRVGAIMRHDQNTRAFPAIDIPEKGPILTRLEAGLVFDSDGNLSYRPK